MDAGERPSSLRSLPHQWEHPPVVGVDDLARTIVDLLVHGADVQAVPAPEGVRVSVADGSGPRYELAERRSRST